MSTFQVILIVALALLIVLTIVAIASGWSSRRGLVAWLVVWTAGLVAAILPDATTRVANSLGIERGKDLLLYCTTLAMLVGFFMVYVRLRRLRRQLTLLTRRIALDEVHENRTGDADGA
jgi:hypothetical protein